MSHEKDVQLGLCCMNMTLKIHYKVYASRKIILRTVKEKGVEELKKRILLNLEDLLKMIEWNGWDTCFAFPATCLSTKQIQKLKTMVMSAIPHQKISELIKKYNHRHIPSRSIQCPWNSTTTLEMTTKI